MDINRTTGISEEINSIVADMFKYHLCSEEQVQLGQEVRAILEAAVIVIIKNVPSCPDRIVAIRKIREARMDCNSAIIHGGKY